MEKKIEVIDGQEIDLAEVQETPVSGLEGIVLEVELLPEEE